MGDVKRIAIYGPESTGKSTLAQRLGSYFDEPWSREFVREFWDIRGGKIVVEELGTIALGQIGNEEAARQRAIRVAFADTELLTCVLWDDLLFPGHCPRWVRTEADERARQFSLYLFCDIDVPFVPGPQRCFPDRDGREMCRRLWLEALTARQLPHLLLRGDWAARERAAIDAVEAVLAR